MSKQGGSNYKGTNSQAWAAFALFLQYVERSDFNYLGLEGENLEDFHLVFKDGKKIVGESKAYKIGFPQIKTIINNILRHKQITPQDELLVVCTDVDNALESLIEYLPYYDSKTTEKIAKEKSLSKKQLKLLPQVRYWKVTQQTAQKISEKLFAKIFKVWVPNHRVSEILRDFYEKEILQGSQEGKTLASIEFLDKVEDKKRLIFEDDGYDKSRIQKEKELKHLIRELKNPDSQQWKPNRLTTLSDNPDEHYWILKLLEEKKGLGLRNWDRLWKMSVQGTFVLEVFRIFKKKENISITDNQDYFVEFALQVIEQTTNFFREDFIKTDIVDLCKSVLESARKHDKTIFELVKKLFEPSISKYFYTKHREDNRYEWEEASKLLLELYEKTELSDLKQNIIDYAFERFNLVEDDGQYWHYSPPSIFEIARLHFQAKPQEGILTLVPQFSKQFDAFYKQFGKKLEFKGWEHMGGGISGWGNEFSIQDRHFVSGILRPLIQKLYDENRSDGWKFIVKHCATSNTEEIGIDRPDFLNRASMPSIFKEYKNGANTKKAFEIFSSFIKMRKGIPWKADLIFQELRGDYTKEQKWALVKVSLDEYNNLPVNVFVEQISSDLAAEGHREAADTIAGWVMNPEYHKRQSIGSFNVVGNISKLLDNPKTFDEGVTIFKNYLFSKEFIEKDNDWETWDVAKTLAKITSTNSDIGINILKEVSASKTLTQNQQTLICSSINDLPKEDKDLLEKVYQDFVYPFLQSLDGDISKVEKRITNRYSREQIVQFAEKLAEVRLYDEALYLVKIFVNDSDPILENYPDDPMGNFNYHQKVIEGDDNPTLSTVRGYCAWVLQKFCIRYGRDYIPKILDLVEKLTKGPNYFVRVQACIPLLELVKNRHTVLSDNNKERFLSMEVAERIENMAFDMLTDKKNHKLKAVMKHLAMVFTYMRTLDEKRAMLVLETFKNTGFESVMDEVVPLYIFFAEFRSKSFKDWPWGDIAKFDDKPFKALLADLLKNGSTEIKSVLSWQFKRLPDEISKTPKEKSQITVNEAITLAVSYFEILAGKYEHRVFNNIYRFIEDYIDEYFEACFKLWGECVETEYQYFGKNYSKDKLQEMYWWPFFYNGKILVKIAQVRGNQEFLNWFKKLADYPTDLLIANDLDVAVEYLTSIKIRKEQVEKLFARLMERNPKYYESKQKWLNNSRQNNAS